MGILDTFSHIFRCFNSYKVFLLYNSFLSNHSIPCNYIDYTGAASDPFQSLGHFNLFNLPLIVTENVQANSSFLSLFSATHVSSVSPNSNFDPDGGVHITSRSLP